MYDTARAVLFESPCALSSRPVPWDVWGQPRRSGRRAAERPEAEETTSLSLDEQALSDLFTAEYLAVGAPDHPTPYARLALPRFAVAAYRPQSDRVVQSVIGMFPHPEPAEQYATARALPPFGVVPAVEVIPKIARRS